MELKHISASEIMIQHNLVKAKITPKFAEKLCDLMGWEYVDADWKLTKGVAINVVIVEGD